MRTINAYLLVPFMKITGYRFSKHHRMNETLIYKCVDTVKANLKAGI